MTALATQDLKPSQPRAISQVVAAVRAVAITKTFDRRPVLDKISFAIEPGGCLALLGANGAGKSTLLSILATLTPLTSGTLDLFGQRVQVSNAAIRQNIGLIGHQSMLYRDLSARENLRFFARLYGVDDIESRCEELLKLVDLADRADDAVKIFSRGMVQRLAIARALIHDPGLLLADEPFAGLDLRSTQVLERLLIDLKEVGKTIILVSHDINQCIDLSSRVMVLRHGRVIADMPSQEASRDMLIAKVFGS